MVGGTIYIALIIVRCGATTHHVILYQLTKISTKLLLNLEGGCIEGLKRKEMICTY